MVDGKNSPQETTLALMIQEMTVMAEELEWAWAVATSKVDEEVTTKADEGVTSKADEEVTSMADEEVTSKVDEGVTSKVDEEVTSEVDRVIFVEVAVDFVEEGDRGEEAVAPCFEAKEEVTEVAGAIKISLLGQDDPLSLCNPISKSSKIAELLPLLSDQNVLMVDLTWPRAVDYHFFPKILIR